MVSILFLLDAIIVDSQPDGLAFNQSDVEVDEGLTLAIFQFPAVDETSGLAFLFSKHATIDDAVRK